MKNFFFALFFIFSFLFTCCKQAVEYVTNVVSYSSFEESGTKVTESEYFSSGKKSSDWLLIMYMDADNSLESAIRTDFNEVETGLSTIMNSDRSAKDGYASIRVVVLWDGYYTSKSTRIFDLGPDSSSTYYAGTSTYNIQNVSFVTSADNEVDMSSQTTLTSFLNWVNDHYTATNKILHIADHGSGPGPITRAMCCDSTNSSQYLSSSEFSSALINAGCGNNKLTALLLDVCLGASIEDAYQFRNCAEYMIASPNSTPGDGFNYKNVVSCFKSGTDTKTVCKYIGESFAESYKTTTGLSVSPTVTVIDLSKIEACADAIDALAAAIKDKSASYKSYLQPASTNMYYKGSINYLYDIGYFANQIGTNETTTTAVKNSLSDAIVYSWKQYYSGSDASSFNYNYYEKNNLSFCGITICGNTVSVYGKTGMSTWYTTEIDFGKRSNGWASLLESWFGKYPNGNN